MKIYKSSAGCSYGEYAYVTPLERNNYLCLWTNETSTYPVNVVGEVQEDLEDCYLTEIDLDINDIPLSKTFLFKFFMKHFNE